MVPRRRIPHRVHDGSRGAPADRAGSSPALPGPSPCRGRDVPSWDDARRHIGVGIVYGFFSVGDHAEGGPADHHRDAREARGRPSPTTRPTPRRWPHELTPEPGRSDPRPPESRRPLFFGYPTERHDPYQYQSKHARTSPGRRSGGGRGIYAATTEADQERSAGCARCWP